MYCTECGSEQHELANFCTNCGAAIQDMTSHKLSAKSPAHDNIHARDAHLTTGDRLDLDPEVDQDLMTFVDTNQDYYYRKWYLAEDKEKGITFNIAAFFLTFFWLGYRRMYLYVFFLSLIFLGIDYSI